LKPERALTMRTLFLSPEHELINLELFSYRPKKIYFDAVNKERRSTM
jgi:hypothetical protein